MNSSTDALNEIDPKLLQELSFLLVDLLAGDDMVLARPEYRTLDTGVIQKGLSYLLNNPNLDDSQKADLLANSWRINYRDRPPTPDNFISEKYLGPSAIHTYPRIKNIFKEYLDPSKPYRNLILFPHIGFGKSYLSTLINIYIGVHLSMMRNPYKFFGLNPASILTQLLISYSLKKSSELLLEPMIAILESSPFFEKVHTRESMINKDRDFDRQGNIDKIYWTTAVPTSAIQLSGGANFKLASSPHSLLGLSVCSATLSELSFFRDAGKALSLDTEVLLADGSSKKMQDIQIGDRIAHPYVGETEVIGIPWENIDDCYEIEMEDGRVVHCHANHLWPVSYMKDGEIYKEVVTTQFMIDHPEINFDIPEYIPQVLI